MHAPLATWALAATVGRSGRDLIASCCLAAVPNSFSRRFAVGQAGEL
jgi:hypothetical protein